MSTAAGGPLCGQDLEAFLAQGLTARLSCLDEQGWPYIVPIWFHWDGVRFWCIGVRNAAWVSYIQASPQVALCIDEPETLTRVLCQGIATLSDDEDAQIRAKSVARSMVPRYLGEGALAQYEESTKGLIRWLMVIDVDRLITWRGPARGEHQAK